MQGLLRTTLLTISLAIGIAVALAVAMRPAPSPASGSRVADKLTSSSKLAVIHNPAQASSSPAASSVPPASPIAQPASPPAPVVAAYRDPVARQVGQLEETLQQIEESSQRRERSMLRAIANIQEQLDAAPAPAAPAPQPQPSAAAPPAASAPATASIASEESTAPTGSVRRGEGDDNLTINIQNSDIRQVLEQLSVEAGLNILASKSVTGAVTANLSNVSVETALAAILKNSGFVARREGNIIYVGTPADMAQMSQAEDRIDIRVYRPNYIRAADLQALFTPMLTPSVGQVTVSSPSEVDIPGDQVKTGGNSFTGTDVVLVRDYATVLAELDQIFEEVDVKPRQVAIEAMILSVKLSDTYKFGVNFAALRDSNNARLISGSPLAGLDDISVTEGGLKFGFVDASLALFIDALEEVGDTNVIAAPRLTCLNKQRAEIQIGEELGYISTTVTESSATQTVNFLDVGTLLRIRPNISNDGLIRLEVHPELSTGSVQVQQGLSLPQKAVTQVTTNVACPDGCTVVIGGLIREDLTTTTTQIPLLGSLPYVGFAFRQKTETIDRNEIIVLITPRIVSEPFMCKEGTTLGNDFTQRQSVYFDKMSPIGRRNLGLHHLRAARAAYAAGDYLAAMKQVNLAIHFDPLNRDAIVLRNDIVAAGGFEDESQLAYLKYGLCPLTGPHTKYSRRGYPWKEMDAFGHHEMTALDDPGLTGHTRTILKPTPLEVLHGAGDAVPLPGFETLPLPAASASGGSVPAAPGKPNPGAGER